MNCEKCLYLIDDLVEDELDASIADEANLHLVACSECATQFEALKQEKQLYAHYLFEIEPPKDLWSDLQAKMIAEKTVEAARPAGIFSLLSGWTPFKGFGFLSPAPLMAAVLLILLGIGFAFLIFNPNRKNADEKNVVESAPSKNFETAGIDSGSSTVNENEDENIDAPKETNISRQNKPLNKKAVAKSSFKAVPTKAPKIRKQPVFARDNQLAAINPELAAELARLREARNLETETGRQMEKIEMLLRSFRNARSAEDSELFDVAYEKEQARKLLRKNAQLRQKAGTYGSFASEETLDRVEPVLLDIANLEDKSSREKVQEIRERLKNQNIIASLQAF